MQKVQTRRKSVAKNGKYCILHASLHGVVNSWANALFNIFAPDYLLVWNFLGFIFPIFRAVRSINSR